MLASLLAVLLLILYAAYYFLHTAKPPKLYYQPTDFNKRLVANCRQIHHKYYPIPFLHNGHIQTILQEYVFKTRKIHYTREMIQTPEQEIIGLDWAHPPADKILKGRKATLLLLHGLAGHSAVSYVRNYVQTFLDLGWSCVVMNARGCGGTRLNTPKMFSAGYTEDIRCVAKHVREKIGKHSLLVAVGFSLGANILTKYLAEDQNSVPIDAAVSVANPWNLNVCSDEIFYLYSHYLSRGLIEYLSHHKEQLGKHPQVNVEFASKAATIREFDDRVIKYLFGYSSVQEYYEKESSAHYLHTVKIPLLSLCSQDDPIITEKAIPLHAHEKNSNLIFVITKKGGHPMWLDFKGNEWSVQIVCDFLNVIIDHHLQQQQQQQQQPEDQYLSSGNNKKLKKKR